MSVAIGLSVISLLMSAWAVIKAGQANSVAKQANKIAEDANRIAVKANDVASHEHKLAIYNAVRCFQAVFGRDGAETAKQIFDSLQSASGNAHLYFSGPVVDHLKRYADSAYRVLVARDGMNQYESIGMGPLPSTSGTGVHRTTRH
ncbi:hypothetical protein [Dyella sp.]|uniref:hypothetical protein n=1 Tax=Dyella sp. TaxID=1869338 RepID=UPI002D78C7A4|nr:hypothetical protein [Dyella sp.]HET7329897.1 hypothetical protein [Dyella sp.]